MTSVHARTRILDTEAETLRDHIADLTRTRSHREQLHRAPAAGGSRTHFVKVPPLLDQLATTDPTSEAGARSGTSYESRPAVSIEALDTLTRIDLEAARWVRDLGEDDPSTTIGCVSLLGGLAASATRCDRRRPDVDRDTAKVTCCTWHAIAHDVARWWTQARVVTGWDAPAWRPDNTCPNCGIRRALRIRLAERVGFCVECRETWGPEAYQVLAEHIRSESDETRRTTVAMGPCMCRWPRSLGDRLQEQVRPLAALCPKCGSASCEHAVRSTGRKAV